jgi:pimeloyl-ACP methyl ester carboxylesterase
MHESSFASLLLGRLLDTALHPTISPACLLVLAFASSTAHAQEPLARRAELGMRFGAFTVGQGLAIRRVAEGSAAARAGILEGDMLVAIAGRRPATALEAEAALQGIRSGRRVELEVATGTARRTVTLTFPAQPLDQAPGVEFAYEEIRNPATGLRQRVIVSRPANATGPLPAVLFMPWLSCDSIEAPEGRRGGIETLLYRIAAEAGVVLMRIEKPGVGDSEGDCTETDLDTELAGHRAAYEALKAYAWVDRTRIVAMGQSFSGSFLPRIVPPAEASGYLFINSFVRTWLERIIQFERKRLEAGAMPPAAISERMRKLGELYGLVLEGGLTPEEAIRRKPALADAWEDAPAHQYGRPIRFMQQLQALNAAEVWSKVDKPTLAVHGEADIVMAREEHERVVALVNTNRAGAARLITVPGMGHGMDAPLPGGGEGLPEGTGKAIVDWLRETLRVP